MPMTIDEMQQQKEVFEARLRNVAAEIVAEFQSHTGLHVDGVYIDLQRITTIGAPDRSIVTGARLDVHL